MRGTRRFEVDVLDAGLVQHLAGRANCTGKRIGFLGAHSNPEEFQLRLDRLSIGKDAINERLAKYVWQEGAAARLMSYQARPIHTCTFCGSGAFSRKVVLRSG
jgi:hypothetical protein